MVRIEREVESSILKTFISDRLTREDFFKLLPALQHTLHEWVAVRWYIEFRDFEGWEPMDALDNLKFDVGNPDEMKRIAIVGAEGWEEWFVKAMRLFSEANIRSFEILQKEEARDWITEEYA